MEAYRAFFISGLLISILGVSVWPIFQLHWLRTYPQDIHSFLMIAGFLFSYVSGFLMTAVPRMSQTKEAGRWEIRLGLGLLWSQVIFALIGRTSLNYQLATLQFLFLLVFVGRCWFQRNANPPPGFVFIPVGLLSGLVGCAVLGFSTGSLPLGVWAYAKVLLFQAFILNLILGLGSRLVPALTRVRGALDVRGLALENKWNYLGWALLLNVSFPIEVFFSPSLGHLCKFAVIAAIAVQKFKIYRARQTKGALSVGIRIAVHLLALGFLFAAFFPAHEIHFLHLSFIGGFALLTFLISTRVVLAHGGHDLSLELKNGSLIWFAVLFAALALLRVFLGFQADWRPVLLSVLAAGGLALCLFWSKLFLNKLVGAGGGERHKFSAGGFAKSSLKRWKNLS